MNLALILLTGSRAWTDIQALEDALLDVWHDALQNGYDGIELLHGCAEGVDTLGDTWAKRHGVSVRPRPADWGGPCDLGCRPGHRKQRYGGSDFCPQAGHRRNQQMVNEHPALTVAAAVPCTAPKCTGKPRHDSHGVTDCIRRAQKAGIPVRPVLRP